MHKRSPLHLSIAVLSLALLGTVALAAAPTSGALSVTPVYADNHPKGDHEGQPDMPRDPSPTPAKASPAPAAAAKPSSEPVRAAQPVIQKAPKAERAPQRAARAPKPAAPAAKAAAKPAKAAAPASAKPSPPPTPKPTAAPTEEPIDLDLSFLAATADCIPGPWKKIAGMLTALLALASALLYKNRKVIWPLAGIIAKREAKNAAKLAAKRDKLQAQLDKLNPAATS